ncbi:uncharacterized protein K02A2.6-like [Salvelinus fontinalis]|uniref:uncharacterized protein K02A2.6-like n=1 Tax=Salvelinus fontinalis TaxID=8038 RepID=UPI0024869AC7|nr:uncharacterized protein K02A2.6-like [Salvelinus fontinalis]
MLEKHKELFKDGYGEIQDFTTKVRVQEGTKPIFHKPRPVPYALKEAVEKELDRLQKNNIITKVARSDWAAPIVVVPKKDKTVRMCGDYKVTVNRCTLPEEYPLPNAEDLFATLAGGKVFSKLDLAFAYQQLKLDPESEQYLTINTHKGLFRFNRLAYGISTAPAIFQHTMDQILDGIDNVVCFMDDILVSAPTIGEHLAPELLRKVCGKLVHIVASASPTAAGRYKVELVPTMRRSIQDLQTASAKEQVACPLQHRDEAETRV